MARQITLELARKIVKKLKAKKIPKRSSAHDFMVVEENGQDVASFGIRRGSEKDQGHDHIPKNLLVTTRFAKDLANCPKSRQDWIDHMKERGLIQDSDS